MVSFSVLYNACSLRFDLTVRVGVDNDDNDDDVKIVTLVVLDLFCGLPSSAVGVYVLASLFLVTASA